MKLFVICFLSIICFLLILYILISSIIFKLVFKRMKKEILLKDVDLSKTHYKPFMDMVISNMDKMMSIPYEEVSIKSFDGLNLYGKYYKNGNSTKTCIFFHGYHADPYNNLNTPGLILLEKGYNILAITERSHGKSEGKYITFGVKESKDAKAWFKFLNDNYKPDEILAWGVSMGAGILGMVADKLPLNVKALVLDCGFSGSYEMVKFSCKSKNKITLLFMPGIKVFTRIIGKFKLSHNEAKEALSKTKIPCFFIHGNKDILVPIEMGKKNYEVVNSYKYFFETNVGHAISIYPYKDEIIKRLDEFLKNIK